MGIWRRLVWVGLVVGVGYAQGPARVSGGVMDSQIAERVQPVYPPIARAAHVSGAVVLHAVIGREGTVENLEVVSGPQMLRQSAMDAVSHWRYRPYLMNGQPTVVDTTITVSYGFESTAPGAPVGGVMGGTGGPGPMPRLPSPDGAPRQARISSGVMERMILTKVEPVYPAEAKSKGISGAVVLRAMIGKDGRVMNLSVISGAEELRQSAVEAVSQWTYKPYLLNGEAVEVETTVTVNCSMGGR